MTISFRRVEKVNLLFFIKWIVPKAKPSEVTFNMMFENIDEKYIFWHLNVFVSCLFLLHICYDLADVLKYSIHYFFYYLFYWISLRDKFNFMILPVFFAWKCDVIFFEKLLSHHNSELWAVSLYWDGEGKRSVQYPASYWGFDCTITLCSGKEANIIQT